MSAQGVPAGVLVSGTELRIVRDCLQLAFRRMLRDDGIRPSPAAQAVFDTLNRALADEPPSAATSALGSSEGRPVDVCERGDIDLIDVAEVARMMKISDRAVRYRIGTFASAQRVGSRYVVDRAEVRAQLDRASA